MCKASSWVMDGRLQKKYGLSFDNFHHMQMQPVPVLLCLSHLQTVLLTFKIFILSKTMHAYIFS